ncbi:preprotein translocase subunit SecG [Clostridium sp. MSJ-11]|uniref:Protein-export membrane protein SecG n=1 Tax=Clostridium mobile TaxID=2841512 RepID=A0ABS6ELD9_9CLOT|nr:preprotein translocase subunit SecG [Clostridium mobile]MBU5486036.1 preprotein translocase subunit SecG [Clostridium mobile]
MKTFLIAAQIVLSFTLIGSVLAQPAKSSGFSLMTGSSETFYSKNKGRTFESAMSKLTIVSAILFAAVTLALNLI